MSVFAWATFIICTIVVIFHYMTTGDPFFLLYAIPALAMLLVIPLTLSWMSRKSFIQASEEHSTQARLCKIGKINLRMAGNIVKVSGTVRKISFKWLNRPHFQVKDETANIRVIMFTSPTEEIKVDDKVEVLGVVMKNLFARKIPVISAVSIKKIN